MLKTGPGRLVWSGLAIHLIRLLKEPNFTFNDVNSDWTDWFPVRLMNPIELVEKPIQLKFKN